MKRAVIFLLGMVLGFSFTAPAYAFKNGDVQMWNTAGVEVKLNDR